MDKKPYIFHYKFVLPLITLTLTTLLFYVLYHHDNKYTSGPPYGKDGLFSFSQNDLSGPLFLIDGWEFYPNQEYSPTDFNTASPTPPQITFIGQYSNFSQLSKGHSPFGSATYRLVLDYDGPPLTLALEIPELFTKYILWADEQVVASSESGNLAGFPIENRVTLLLQTFNDSHYYSGMVYPPALGTPSVISRLLSARSLFYSILCVSSVTLALFASVLWMTQKKAGIFLHFGILCLASGLSCCHFFIQQFGLNTPLWYGMEDAARMLLFMEAIEITTITVGLDSCKWYRYLLRPLMRAAVLITFFMVTLIIPLTGFAVNVYGYFVEILRVLCWFYLVVCAGMGLRDSRPICIFTLSGSIALGVGILANLLDNNYYEPIYTGWQSEYTGFFLVLIFSGMMIWYNHQILAENETLTEHLENVVALKTSQLEGMLNERKDFFSDVAHSLKSPVASIHGFISLIRQQQICIDDELADYLDLIERKNLEMNHRIQTLNVLNAFDRIHTPFAYLSTKTLMEQIFSAYKPDADADGIYLTVSPHDQDTTIYAQEEKLMLMFENLFYNSLSFTPPGGTITLSATVEEHMVVFLFQDNGAGISPEHLPHIFERFYTVRKKRAEGSGLGLYIVRLTAEELGGSVSADSEPGKGTTFMIRLPKAGHWSSEPERRV